MADYLIPLKSDSPHFDLSIDLSGREHRLEFHWSFREASWYVRIYTDTDGRDLEPTWDESTQRGDLGRRVVLQYFEAL